MEILGLFFGIIILGFVASVLGVGIGLCTWLLFLRRSRPWHLIIFISLMPAFTFIYLFACGIIFTLFIPNSPDLIFHDFNEPLPNGYVLTGLGKMSDYARIETTTNARDLKFLGTISKIQLNGPVVLGAYGHLDSPNGGYEFDDGTNQDHGYFAFDTRTGVIQNFPTMDALKNYAGIKLDLIDSVSFSSQEPDRIRIRRIEDFALFLPPGIVFASCIFLIFRARFRPAS